MCLDLCAVGLLLITGRPDRGLEVGGSGSTRHRWAIAGAIGLVWFGVAAAMWFTRPTIAAATTATVGGQTFGKPGELVVLEPEKWAGQKFSLAEHIDVGKQLSSGRWIVLLVHHDCDHCAAAVPKYVAEYGGGRRWGVGQSVSR